MLQRTAKSCGPDAPTLASSSRRQVGPTGRGQSLNPLSDGGKQARSPGRARRKPLKPLRAGMPGDSGVLVVTRVRSTTIIAHETAGATGTRRSPRPLWAEDLSTARARCAARANVCLMNTNAQRSQPSSPAKAGDPVFRGVSDGIEKLRRTGYSAFAEYDGTLWSRSATQVHHIITRREATKQCCLNPPSSPTARADGRSRGRRSPGRSRRCHGGSRGCG
jgi:hypothetical protein